MSDEGSRVEKESAAKSGIAAGALLAVIELMGGLISGSLGLLSSAVNTIMGFTASVVAFFAVREASKPPDEMHHYGHLKYEAFAAILEIGLLFIVCVWLVATAIGKMLSGGATVEFLWIAIGTNFASVAIDLYAYTRFRSATKKHGSEALGAGALHFLNDLMIAFVVIVGLSVYGLGLWYADSIAALGVVAVTLYSSLDVLRSSVNMLMDTAPKEAVEKLRTSILGVNGVEGCHHIRVRRAGPKYFVDAHVEVRGSVPLSRAHAVTESIETEINKVFPGSDVVIHTEPRPSRDAIAKIREVASEFPEVRGVHEISVSDIGDRLFVSYHIEMGAEISLERAHEIAHKLDDRLKESLGKPAVLISHLEPILKVSPQNGLSSRQLSDLRARIIRIAEEDPQIRSAHDIESLSVSGTLCITLHCTVDGALSLDQAHEIATRLEERIKAEDSRIGHVIIHCEPQELQAEKA
jgi:cation diffusion facilitator family transporter